MNNKKLLYILVVLGLIFLVSQLYNQKKDRSFRSEFLALDTASISKIILHPKADDQQECILEKNNGTWTAQQGSLKVPVAEGSLNGILSELVSIKIKSIATQSEERWNDYEIGDSTGSRVEVFSGNKKLVDFYSGKFGFNPQGNSMTSYIRMAGESQVFAIDGFQSMTFNTGFDNFRNKTFLDLEPGLVTSINAESNGESHNLVKINTQWTLDGKEGPDSTAVANFLNTISRLTGTSILDGYQPSGPATIQLKILEGAEPINLDVFPSQDSLKPFILHSSLNPEVHFHEDSSGIFSTLVTGFHNLVKGIK